MMQPSLVFGFLYPRNFHQTPKNEQITLYHITWFHINVTWYFTWHTNSDVASSMMNNKHISASMINFSCNTCRKHGWRGGGYVWGGGGVRRGERCEYRYPIQCRLRPHITNGRRATGWRITCFKILMVREAVSRSIRSPAGKAGGWVGKERREEGGGRREESVGISWSLSLPYMKVSNNSNHYEIRHSTHRRPWACPQHEFCPSRLPCAWEHGTPPPTPKIQNLLSGAYMW